ITGVTVPAVTAPQPTVFSTHPAPATTNPPPTAPPVSSMPAGFHPLSVTFVSPEEGWVLGDTTAGGPALVGRTTDGGATWSLEGEVTAKPAGYQGLQIRFADPEDGWVYATGPTNNGNVLWSTHDGGASWVAQQVTGVSTASPRYIADLEASGGEVYMAANAGAGGFSILSTPAGADNWTASPTVVPFGAGPVPDAQITLQGRDGWIVENDRTVTAGARLTGGAWSNWTPPCKGSGGAAAVAASSTTDLVAVCEEGVWGPSDLGPGVVGNWLYTSSDGGSTWQPVGQVTSKAFPPPALTTAPADPATVVTDGANGLVATFDGGHTWYTVYPASASYVGFTTATQGVAIVPAVPAMGGGGSTMIMTRDGGHTWQPVTF
ncbi:MAG TPA: YCF48-related protein, partial [Acidimicrobiales bacterium]|nr:YCF48-related protein [Acidimicrobiales bacterium]